MTLIKAYEDLWKSRYMKVPVNIVNTLGIEELQGLVNRSWKTERNLNQLYPVPISHTHNRTDGSGLPSIAEGFHDYLHIAKGRLLFSRVGKRLACGIISDQGQIEPT